MGKKAIHEAAAETRLIEAELRKHTTPGDFVTYVSLTTICGCNVQERGRGFMNTARGILERDGYVWGPVKGEGLKLMDAEGVIDVATSKRKSIGRQANKILKKINTINIMEADENLRNRVVAEKTVAVMLKHSASERRQTKLLEATKNQTHELPVGKALELFK